MVKLKSAALVASPIGLVAILVALEVYVFRDRDPISAVGNQLATLKMAVDLSNGLVTLFISIATATIGAVAYYLRTRLESFDTLPRRSLICLVLCIAASVLSMYFGHLQLVTMRNQLVLDGFEATSWVMQWTERLQFAALIMALGWFGLLVIEREASRSVVRHRGD